MEDHAVNTILIFNLLMSNTFVSDNCKNEGFKVQRSKDDLLEILVESITIFVES